MLDTICWLVLLPYQLTRQVSFRIALVGEFENVRARKEENGIARAYCERTMNRRSVRVVSGSQVHFVSNGKTEVGVFGRCTV